MVSDPLGLHTGVPRNQGVVVTTAVDSKRSTQRWWALALIAMAQFMVIMDTSIIGVALPRIQADLGFDQQSLS
jgi:hypothetical protein